MYQSWMLHRESSDKYIDKGIGKVVAGLGSFERWSTPEVQIEHIIRISIRWLLCACHTQACQPLPNPQSKRGFGLGKHFIRLGEGRFNFLSQRRRQPSNGLEVALFKPLECLFLLCTQFAFNDGRQMDADLPKFNQFRESREDWRGGRDTRKE
jgi:hypothetical protein